MKDRISILDLLIERIINEGNFTGIKVVLFGSFLNKDKYNDIDILLVYKDIPFSSVKELKSKIFLALQDEFTVPVHFTTLRLEEYLADLELQQISCMTIINKLCY